MAPHSSDSHFDPRARLEAQSATDLQDLLSQFGNAGLINGPRTRVKTGQPRRTATSNEAFLARRLLCYLAEKSKLEFPVSVAHRDAPDFELAENGASYGLEVTEASTQEDGHEMARSESKGEHLVGTLGGRGHGGYHGDKPELEVISDIQNAIARKACKDYATGTIDLLIYPNSNPVRVLTRPEQLNRVITADYVFGPFRRVFVFWDTQRINQILPSRTSQTPASNTPPTQP